MDNVRIYGRHLRPSPSSIAFDHPGVEVAFSVRGAVSAFALLSRNASAAPSCHASFVVYCDGGTGGDVDDDGTIGPGRPPPTPWPIPYKDRLELCSGLDPRKVTEIRLVKDSEAMRNCNAAGPGGNVVTLRGFDLVPPPPPPSPPAGESASSRATPPPPPPEIVSRREDRRPRIEFLGDSITAGFGTLCDASPPSPPDGGGASPYAAAACSVPAGSYVRSYAFHVCEALGADCHVAAWSGLGVVANCCGDDTFHMPDVWERTLASVSLEGGRRNATPAWNAWDFKSWKPHALVVNLGTNDVSGGLVKRDLVGKYEETLLDLLRAAADSYGPDTRFILACGPMRSQYCEPLRRVADRLLGDGLNATVVDHSEDGTRNNCCGHPGSTAHAAMATRMERALLATLPPFSEASPEGGTVPETTNMATSSIDAGTRHTVAAILAVLPCILLAAVTVASLAGRWSLRAAARRKREAASPPLEGERGGEEIEEGILLLRLANKNRYPA